MRKACIAIGVDEVCNVAKLTHLRAASKGAEEFAAWAKRSDPRFETQCVTDRVDPVGVSKIKELVDQIVTSQSYGQLLIYFAGHGLLKTWDTELWLLSRAASDPNEAVNLVGSVRYARNSGIPHILFVSDACRSVSADAILGQVDGSLIFPTRRVPLQRAPEVDVYYASLPGDPSYEIPAEDACELYDGVFTKCLLEGLKGLEPALRERVDEDQQRIEVVSSRTLKPWLEEKVQRAMTAASIALEQIPEVRVESQAPKYLTRVNLSESHHTALPTAPLPATVPLSSSSALRAFAEDNGIAHPFLPDGEMRPQFFSRSRAESMLNQQVDELLAAKSREPFETRTGFTIIGSKVAGSFVDGIGGRSDLFEESGSSQIRVYEQPRPQSVVIQFENGNGTCLAALPGYIGTVVVKDHCVVSVSYTPSRNSFHWPEYQYAKDDLEKRRAFTAVAARRGIFKIEPENAASFAGFIRQLKYIDPTLGIYAAYAYSQIGRMADVVSVYEWMREEQGVPVPFDVALLSDRLDEERDLGRRRILYAPWTPMLTQGWALLHEELPIANWLLEARRYTLPSLWTTFGPDGCEFVKERLSAGV